MGDEIGTIDRGPLGAAEARLLALPFLEANAARAERCVERAAGNPLFLEQLLRDAEEDPETGVPGSVQSLIQARIDRLAPTDKAALQAASVLGQRFDLASLRHVLGQPGYAVDRLADRLLVRPDEDGFLFITDRVSRFSKIGGEMVPHVRVEDTVSRALGGGPCVVTAVPDAAKGERMVVFYVQPDVAPEVLWQRLHQSDLPNLWVPRRDCLIPIDAIPTLGTGKTDLRRVKQLALELSPPA